MRPSPVESALGCITVKYVVLSKLILIRVIIIITNFDSEKKLPRRFAKCQSLSTTVLLRITLTRTIIFPPTYKVTPGFKPFTLV